MTETTTALPRTDAEILARKEVAAEEDPFGFRFEVLLNSLSYDAVKPILKPGVGPEDWTPDLTVEAVTESARTYLTFGIGKIIDHRGVSAWRTVAKLREFAWLLGRDDVVTLMDDTAFAQYGAPKVKAFAVAMDWADLWPTDNDDLDRMSRGLRCNADYACGCGF